MYQADRNLREEQVLEEDAGDGIRERTNAAGITRFHMT
jgi:hypothetical protein